MNFDIERRASIPQQENVVTRGSTFRAATAQNIVNYERSYATEGVPFCHIYRDKLAGSDEPTRALRLPPGSLIVTTWFDLFEVCTRVPYLGAGRYNPVTGTGDHDWSLRLFAEAGLRFRLVFLDDDYSFIEGRTYELADPEMTYDSVHETYEISDTLPTGLDPGDKFFVLVQQNHLEEGDLLWWGALGWWHSTIDITPAEP
jgi:hypothetical protein